MDEVPVMQSWATQALELFDEERRELHEALATLQAAHEAEMNSARTRITAEVEAQLRRDYPALATATTRRQNKPRNTNNTAGTATGGNAQENYLAQIAEERERGISARLDELEQRYNAQVWRSLVQDAEHELETVRQVVEPVRALSAKEYAFFSARPSAAYTMDDILGSGRIRSNNTTTTNTTGNHIPTTFTIDAVAFAEEYNAALQREYGYKPILGSSRSISTRTDVSSSSASHPSRADIEGDAKEKDSTAVVVIKGSQSLRERLRTHVPADCEPDTPTTTTTTTTTINIAAPVHPPPAAVSQDNVTRLPLLAPGKARSTPDYTSTTMPPSLQQNVAQDVITANNDKCDVSLPPLRPSSTGVKATRTKLSSETSEECVEQKKRTKGRDTKVTSDAAGHVSPVVLPSHGIECSVLDRTVRLESCTDDEVRTTVRFTNRNAYRTRLRLHAATHPWLTYRCTRLAPVAGGTSDLSTQDGLQGVLSCGGYMEVLVTFSPQDLTEATLHSTLRVGVTRELNARSAEGAQWHFIELNVKCLTRLPCFELHCESESAAADTTSTGSDKERKKEKDVNSRGKRASPAPQCNTDIKTGQTSSLSEDVPLAECVFQPTFVMATRQMSCQLINVGSTAMINILSSSPAFVVQPAAEVETLVPHGDCIDLRIAFSPLAEGLCEAELTVAMREDSAGPVVREQIFTLRGTGLVPRVQLIRIGETPITPGTYPQWWLTQSSGAARYLLPDTTPHVTSTTTVVVRNDTEVDLPFHWRATRLQEEEEENESVEKDTVSHKVDSQAADENGLVLRPASGRLPAQGEMSFTLQLTPPSTKLFYAAWSLFLDGLPDPATLSPTRQALVAEEVLHLCSRSKRIPCRASKASGPKALSVDFFSDPFAVFRQCTCAQSATAERAVFATGFYIFAQPSVPQAVLQPAVWHDEVGCLVGQSNVRTVTLRNASTRPMHFTMERPVITTTLVNNQKPQGTESRAVEISCSPARGVVAAGSALELTLQYTLHSVGRYHVVLGCRIAEVMACLPAHAPCSHSIALDLRGIGPLVRTNTRLLDFGLIELNEEAQASFTIVSDHVMPITVDIKERTAEGDDASGGSSRCLRFTPTTCRLTCNGTARVTVHRIARTESDTSGFIELHIRGNEHNPALVLETCCSVQRANVRLREAALHFDVVPEAIWQAAELHLDNYTDLDTEYTIVADNNIQQQLMTGRVEFDLPAGWQKIARRACDQCIPLRVRFFRPTPSSSSSAVQQSLNTACNAKLLIQLRKATQLLALPVTCAAVEALTVSVDVVTKNEENEEEETSRLPAEAVLERMTGIAGPHDITQSDTTTTSMTSFVQALLWNALELALYGPNSNTNTVSSYGDAGRPPVRPQTNSASTRAVTSSEYSAMNTMQQMNLTSNIMDSARGQMLQLIRNSTSTHSLSEWSGALMRYYGGVVTLSGEMPETQPYYATSIALCIRNYTGCQAQCTLHATHYIPLPESDEVPQWGSATRRVHRSPLHKKTNGPGSNVSGERSQGGQMRGSAFTPNTTQPFAQTLASRLCHTLRSTKNAKSSGGGDAESTLIQTLPLNSLLATTDTAGFWASMQTGAAQVQRMHRTRLDEITHRLLDGRGCATLIAPTTTTLALPSATHASEAEQTTMLLAPQGCITWPVTFLSNLPGCYEERLLVHFDQSVLSPLVLPVRLTLHGKPLLLDPTTSGLTRYTVGNTVQDVVDMPSVIAAVGCARRTLRLINRTPRDVLVRVRFSVCPFTFAVGFVHNNSNENSNEDDSITLRLVPLSAEAEARESVGRGHGRVVPAESFLLPATGSREVMLEYTPEVAMVAHILAELDQTVEVHHSSNSEGSGISHGKGACEARTADTHQLTNCGSVANILSDDENDEEYESINSSNTCVDQIQPRAAQEVTWTGSLLITAELAATEYNDAFIIDEFYAIHRTRYPTVRQVKLPVTVPQPHSMTPSLRVAPYLPVIPPQRSRTGPGRVLWRNRILSSAGTERAVLARALTSRAQSAATVTAQGSSSPRINSNTVQCLRVSKNIYDEDNTSSSDSEDEAQCVGETSMLYDAQTEAAGADSSRTSGQVSSVPLVPFDENESAARPAAVLLAEEDERRALREYIAQRRAELHAESLQTFVPLEVQLRARCGIPRLAVQPSAQGVHLPRYVTGRWCGRSVRLTNHNSAALCFTLAVNAAAAEYFRIATVELVKSNGAHSAAITISRNIDNTSEQANTATTVILPCYRLRSGEAVDVVIEVIATAAHMHSLVSLAHPKHTIRGELEIAYQSEDAINMKKYAAPRQAVPLYVTVANPRVHCSPAQLWFKPGTLVHDGRAQTHYAQRLTLINDTTEAVQFTLKSIALRALHSSSVDPSALTPAAQVTWARKIREVMHMPSFTDSYTALLRRRSESGKEYVSDGRTSWTVVEDAAHFTLEPTTGVIPAASAGGQPGKVHIAVTFHEHSNVRYECAYAVYINGQPSEAVFVLRGDSRETEL